ncbi:MAG: hypothetical protein Hyperionvirus37_1 [Hyperionvirus sp.]|uniref:Uncharacterized protein n=1 Tax=Hyperionvirus sp. TaxID=2487770 RepID=A0A3G5ABX0_9VIRU|nr:MAG: hypothetical protein Hyperionvirus37_1 [Hyperionvirus sp.]
MNITKSDNVSYVNIVIIVALIAIFLWLIYPCFTSVDRFEGDMNPVEGDSNGYGDDAGEMRETEVEKVMMDQYQEPVAWDASSKLGSGFQTVKDYTLVGDKCSPSCCSPQWPVPFKTEKLSHSEDYVLNNYYCNDGTHNSGCLCMKKDQLGFLESRGLNTNF